MTTVEQKIIAGIQALASSCDGARDRDNSGFNAGDAWAGHRLAALGENIAQRPPEFIARIGEMLLKYSRQIDTTGIAEYVRTNLPVSANTGSKTDTRYHGITLADERLIVDMGGYHPDLVRSLKASISQTDRRFDGESKTWNIALSAAGNLAKWAADNEFTVSQQAVEACRNYQPVEQKPARYIDADELKFIINFPYNRDVVIDVKELPGRRFDPATKKWSIAIGAPGIAAGLYEFTRKYNFHITPAADQAIEASERAEERKEAEIEKATKTKLAESVSIAVGGLKGELWSHQKKMVQFSSQLDASLWDAGMGTGKTKAAIALILKDRPALTLIVCPLSVVPVWKFQWRTHVENPADFEVCELNKGSVAKKMDKASQAIATGKALNKPVILVINYDSLWRKPFADWIKQQSIDLMILDESHKIKSPKGTAAKFVGEMGYIAKKRLMLSGTPMAHSPLDIWSQYRFADPSIFGDSFYRFKTRYAILGGYQGKQIIGFQRKDELAAKYDSIRLEVTRDVLDLPDAVHSVRPFCLEPKARRAYDSLREDFMAMVGKGTVTVNNALSKLLRLQQITSGLLPLDSEENEKTQYERISSGKQDVLEEILDELPTDEPIVVFARFRADLEAIHAAAEKAGRKSAELSGSRKELKSWQRSDGPTVLAAQIGAAAEGVDFTRAAHTVFYSLGFSLAQYEQAKARTHRPGQSRTCFYHHITASHTVDEQVYRALSGRKNVIESIMGELKK